jgi:hypothetical protein
MLPHLLSGFLPEYLALFTGGLFLFRPVFQTTGKRFQKAKIGDETWKNVVGSVYYLTTLVLSLCFGEFITRGAVWRQDYDYCFIGYSEKTDVEWGLRLYYSYAFSFYLFSLVCLFLDEKKKDFAAMALHHVVTLFLIWASAVGNMHKIGAIIMLSFDKSDILLEGAKICNRLKLHNSAGSLFVMFVVSWLNYRVYSYPVHVLGAVFRSQSLTETPIPHLHSCTFLLVIIWLLQLYWSWFIIKKVITIVKKGVADGGDDPREDNFKEHREKKKRSE